MPKRKTWLELIVGLNMWFGLSFGSWLQLLSKYRFAVEPKRILTALITTGVSVLNTTYGSLERLFYAREVAKTKLVAPPIFILGYWRSGTTHLHNMLCRDERFTFPTTYTTMFPHHFLLTERVAIRLLSGVVPKKRAMDNMALSWNVPQEDEVALSLLAGLSPYQDFAFPDTPEIHRRFLDFEDATATERELFKKVLIYFVKKHTFRNRKQVILKSPAHTFRVKLITEAFPGVKFIHIYRDPITTWASAVHLFTILREQIGLRTPDNSKLEQRVVEDMLLCYQRLREDQALLSTDQFHEIRFEDLEKQPLIELEKTYEKLNLGGFEKVRPKIKAYLASIAGYKKNVYNIPPEKRHQLTQNLDPILKAHGY